MWIRRILPLLLALSLPVSAMALDLGAWASREDRILLVVLLDGFDESRVGRRTPRGEELLPAMSELRQSAVVCEDVQSIAPGTSLGLSLLLGGTKAETVDGSPAELGAALRAALERSGPQRLVLSSGLFADPRDLEDALVLDLDPAPWQGHETRATRATQLSQRRQRAEMLQRLYREGRAIRRGGLDAELDWIADAMHARADASLQPLWERLNEPAARDRCIVVLSARRGFADPRRGAPAPAHALRPDLARVPFWILTPGRAPSRIEGRHSNAALLESLLAVGPSSPRWAIPPQQEGRWTVHPSISESRRLGSIFWRTPAWSLLLRSDGAHAIYDRLNDPGEWDDLSGQQAATLETLRVQTAHALLGSALDVEINSDGARELSIQPAEAIADFAGESAREGLLLRLRGEGPWSFRLDPAKMIQIHSSESQTVWLFGDDVRREARQLTLDLTTPELLLGILGREPADSAEGGVHISLRAGEGGALHRP